MDNTNRLQAAFNETDYQLGGHGKRSVEVLKTVLEQKDGELAADMYGKGPLIEGFERKIAAYLGKPSAVFFPSGTMAQQIALRIWCDEKDLRRVGYHPLSHLEIHEERGLHELHQIEAELLGEPHRIVTLADVQHRKGDIAALLLELPQREIGGQLPSYEELEAITSYCRENGIRLHLDGARLFEIVPYYGRSAAEISSLFDSVYVSFYKGIGGVAGAILAGPDDFASGSKIWKRRHGGDLIHLYPYIISADYYFEQRISRMTRYYEDAIELAGYFKACREVVTVPERPVSNMFHVHISRPIEQVEALLIALYEEKGIGLTRYLRPNGTNGCYFELSIGDRYAAIPKARIQEAFARFNELLGEDVGEKQRGFSHLFPQ